MKIFAYDEFNPEDMAMMQALYSRSAESVEVHAEKVKKSGSGKFMERFYVGYGHGSIGDCGSTTIFIEGVSMLVAKAIQQWPLYSGQETSTRYIDMSKQALIDPVQTKESKAILDKWMKFYIGSQDSVREHLKTRYPIKAGEDQAVYDRAINARVFDTLRCFLPAGVTTQLSWHTNLRQAHDKLALLRYYPLPEVRDSAEKIHTLLKQKYANSFGHKEYPEQEAYRKFSTEKYTFWTEKKYAGDFTSRTNIKKAELMEYKDLLKKRTQKTNLPYELADLGNVTFEFLLDFGSFRDIHRHRNGVCKMPLLTTKFGFNEWYLDELSDELKKEAKKLIKDQMAEIKKLKTTKELAQYYIPMGFNVNCKVTYGLPAAIYTTELRSGRLVHPSLRKVAHKMHFALKKMFPDLTLHSELDPSEFDIRRGKQDIVERK